MLLSSKKSIGTFNIPICMGIVGIHVLALMALLPWFWSMANVLSGIVICVLLYIVSGLGITLCYHRLLTHSSFKTSRWFRYVLTICGTLAFQGSVFTWVGTHRNHHNHSDEEDDPHSPMHGGWWAHHWWFMFNDPPGVDALSLTRDLQKDPGLVLIDKYAWVPQLILTLLLFGLGFWVGGIDMALSWIFWGIGVRTTAVYHVTWATNSVCHMWGYRNYKTGDQSRNNLLLAILSLGESWHNNHHYDPSSAAHGTRHWWEVDLTYDAIRLLKLLGLVWDIRPTEEKRRLLKTA